MRWGCRNQSTLNTLLFYDFGDARNHTLLPGEDPSVDLASVGGGLRYSFKNNVLLRMDYAWQTAQVAGVDRRDRLHVGAVIRR